PGVPGGPGGQHVGLRPVGAAPGRGGRARGAQGFVQVTGTRRRQTRYPTAPPLLRAGLNMATDFFQNQDAARRRTSLLVVYFLLAILALVALAYGLLVVVFGQAGEDGALAWWQPELLLLAGVGVGLLVGGSSAFKVAQLASGGQAVALMMGGKEVPRTTRDARDRRLLHVVAEKAP